MRTFVGQRSGAVESGIAEPLDPPVETVPQSLVVLDHRGELLPAGDVWMCSERCVYQGDTSLAILADVTKYVDVADDLRRRISEGEFPVGGRIPAVYDLKAEYGVAANTVRAGLAILREEGLLRINQGEPTIVVKTPDVNKATLLEKLRRIEADVADAIRMLEDSN
jgi:DNA-binding transcriptional regulator YhcF (GntR family)